MKLLHSDDLHHHLGSNCCSEKSKTSTLGFKTPEIKRDVKQDIRKVNLLDKRESDTRIDTHINQGHMEACAVVTIKQLLWCY